MNAGLVGAAARLVADLMPVAIVVADAGAGETTDYLAALEAAGASAERYVPGMAGGFDLAILLAGSGKPRDAASPRLAESLAAISDRLLFVPQTVNSEAANHAAADFGAANAGAAHDADLDAWFELFAEHGYQPVVEYDAGFVAQGAFLVDRNATAAETELSAFAERLSMGGALAASTQRVAVLEAELGAAGDREALKTELTAARGREADLRARLATVDDEMAALRAEIAAWQAMAERTGSWMRAASTKAARDQLAALREAAGNTPKRPRLLTRLRRLAAPADARERQHLADAALIRASTLFDPAWYVASHPAIADTGIDPVWHYVLTGAGHGADPGPYFDSAAYRAAHPDARGNPLADAIRQGRT